MFWKNYGRVLMYDALPRLITIIIIVSVVQVTWRDKRSRWRLQIILLFVVGWRILLHARMSVLFLFKWSVLFIQIFFHFLWLYQKVFALSMYEFTKNDVVIQSTQQNNHWQISLYKYTTYVWNKFWIPDIVEICVCK